MSYHCAISNSIKSTNNGKQCNALAVAILLIAKKEMGSGSLGTGVSSSACEVQYMARGMGRFKAYTSATRIGTAFCSTDFSERLCSLASADARVFFLLLPFFFSVCVSLLVSVPRLRKQKRTRGLSHNSVPCALIQRDLPSLSVIWTCPP